MAFFTSTARQENWLHFNGKLLSTKTPLKHLHLNCRPTTRHGHKVHPSRWEAYRQEHDFRYPCCMCATGNRYVEAAVYQYTRGISRGEYVAECATGMCGYLGKLASKQSLTVADLSLSEYREIFRTSVRTDCILSSKRKCRNSGDSAEAVLLIFYEERAFTMVHLLHSTYLVFKCM
jgi:hypothetical protein